MSPSAKVSSVWLFSGREQDRNSNIQFAELSSWAEKNYTQYHSGIGTLTPAYSCLDDMLPAILGLPDEELNAKGDFVSNQKDSPAAPTSAASPVQTSGLQSMSISARNFQQITRNRCLPLIVELYGTVEDSELLFKSRWSELNLGIAHPLLRKSMPKGRESNYYIKTEIDGASCYAYSNWLPNYENKLRSYVEKRRRKSETETA